MPITTSLSHQLQLCSTIEYDNTKVNEYYILCSYQPVNMTPHYYYIVCNNKPTERNEENLLIPSRCTSVHKRLHITPHLVYKDFRVLCGTRFDAENVQPLGKATIVTFLLCVSSSLFWYHFSVSWKSNHSENMSNKRFST